MQEGAARKGDGAALPGTSARRGLAAAIPGARPLGGRPTRRWSRDDGYPSPPCTLSFTSPRRFSPAHGGTLMYVGLVMECDYREGRTQEEAFAEALSVADLA